MKLNSYRISYIAGWVGSLTILVGSLITAILYTGSKGEAYSPLNHWVSELGQVSVSQAAGVFNISLIIGGICFALFQVGLTSRLKGRFRLMLRIIGLFAGVAGTLVGIFPMDNLVAHAVVAFLFFIAILLMVGLFSLYIMFTRQTPFPRWLVIPGGVIVLSIIACMLSIGSLSLEALAAPTNRLPVWNAAIFEWVAIGGVLVWTFWVALCLRLAENRSASAAA